MSRDSLTQAQPSPADRLEQVIAVCDRFEAAWRAGQHPRIEDYLAGNPELDQSDLLRRLRGVELELAHEAGRTPTPAECQAPLPSFLEQIGTVFGEGSNDSTGELRPDPDPAAKYQPLRLLGQGGQAMTFLARDRALQRQVVLKCYRRGAAAALREAVLNEGRALARIHSRYVAQCYDIEAQGDEILLVMEYVPGKPLSALSAAERGECRQAVRWVEQIAEGLAEVHACGLLHRDIKPQNILIGDNGRPRLVDFGLAAPLASESLQAISGSPPYMAPEQARGQGERIDPRTDVFGLGAVLYFLLTGHPPYDGQDRRTILERACQGRFVPLRQLNPKVPRLLERICLKAMAPAPEQRYANAEAFRQALWRYRQWRNSIPALIAGGLVLVLVLMAGWMSWPKHSPLRIVRLAIEHFPRKDQQQYDPGGIGLLGERSFGTRLGDDVTVEAELSQPAFAYLIAFRPDGTVELCDPEDEDTRPRATRQPGYPPGAKADEVYRLEDESGLQAFALVASRAPLPPFQAWKQCLKNSPWQAGLPADPGVVWRADGERLEDLTAQDAARTRGKGAKARGGRPAVAELARWLRHRPGVEAVAVEAFAVEPAASP